MKSPIKSKNNLKLSLEKIKEIIEPDQSIKSFLFFDGFFELMLSRCERQVTAHTDKMLIYEFWRCLCEDSNRIYELVTSEPYKFQGERLFEILQRTWPSYTTGFPRAALFFLLNRCSSTGSISTGKLDNKNFNPIALNYLKMFQKPEKFNLRLMEDFSLIKQIQSSEPHDFVMLPIGKFSYNFFDHGKNRGFEDTHVDNKKLRDLLSATDQKMILIYNFHPHLSSFYSKQNLLIIGKNGCQKSLAEQGDEIIVTNF